MQHRLHTERFLLEQGADAYRDLADHEQTRLFSERITTIGLVRHQSWASTVSDAVAAVRATHRTEHTLR